MISQYNVSNEEYSVKDKCIHLLTDFFFVYFQIKIYSLLSKSDLFSLFHFFISDTFHLLYQDGPTKWFETRFPTFSDIE